MTTQCSETTLSHDNTAFCLSTVSWLISDLHLHFLMTKKGLILWSKSWPNSVLPFIYIMTTYLSTARLSHDQTVVCLMTTRWSTTRLFHDQHSILATANVRTRQGCIYNLTIPVCHRLRAERIPPQETTGQSANSYSWTELIIVDIILLLQTSLTRGWSHTALLLNN